MSFTLSLTIIFITTALTTLAACSYLGKKIDDLSEKIERRNRSERKSRRLFRHDD